MPTASFARSFDVSASPERSWQALTDVSNLVTWVSVLSEAQEQERLARYSAVLADRLGMFRLRADLDIEVSEVDEERSITVSARGEDRQVASRISVDAVLGLEPIGEGTTIHVEGTYEVAGKVATMGASTIRKKADRILEEFFSGVAEELG